MVIDHISSSKGASRCPTEPCHASRRVVCTKPQAEPWSVSTAGTPSSAGNVKGGSHFRDYSTDQPSFSEGCGRDSGGSGAGPRWRTWATRRLIFRLSVMSGVLYNGRHIPRRYGRCGEADHDERVLLERLVGKRTEDRPLPEVL